ncbi:MAG: NADH-quinone oxidoreductase subunit N [Pirellulaceae bacterium]
MNLHELVSQFIMDSRGLPTGGSLATPDSSLGVFLPELALCGTILLMLLLRIFGIGQRVNASIFAFAGSAFALYLAAPWFHLGIDQVASSPYAASRMEIFTGMLVYDPFTVFMRAVLIGFALLFTVFTWLSGIPDREDSADIYTLVLGATLGMCLMASANHLLMMFLAVEMASVPSYALAGLLKGRRLASEAALKYSVFGAGTAGVMLYGISLITGLLNTAHLPTLAWRLAERLPECPPSEVMVLALGGLMIAVGLAFKLSAVPFHFWCPDVFEGASAEVNAFLSVASKAAALALLVRVALGFGAIPEPGYQPGARSLALAAQSETAQLPAAEARGLFAVAEQDTGAHAAPADGATEPTAPHATAPHSTESHATEGQPLTPRQAAIASLAPARSFMGVLITFFAVITCTFGNLAAYGQTNIKRLLAYSTIAHAGYMMMPVAALMEMVGKDSTAAASAVGGLAIYITVYLFMNLGAFVVVAFLRNAMRSEEIADYAGLIRSCPLTVICFSLILFSLVGLPPLAGFVGKFAVFASLADGYQISVQAGRPASYLIVLLVVGGLNTAVSLFYYLRIVKTMTMDEPSESRRPFSFPDVSLQGVYLWLVTAPTILLILNWEGLKRWSEAAAAHLLS